MCKNCAEKVCRGGCKGSKGSKGGGKKSKGY